LESLGYKIINIKDRSLIQGNSDFVLSCAGSPTLKRGEDNFGHRTWPRFRGEESSLTRLEADDFTGALLSTTSLYPVLRFFNVVERQIWDRRLCDFTLIVDVRDIEGPKFVYAHLSVPHPPWIFDRNGIRDPESLSTFTKDGRPLGETIATGYVKEPYIDQVDFVSKKLQDVVHALLSGKGNPPIIIIQADHGAYLHSSRHDPRFFGEKFGILNAYYLPNGGNDLLYESISPVNTFRVIFNHYFGADYPVLDDKSIYTGDETPWVRTTPHVDVTDLITE
jgi:hypothetical protein